MELQNLLDFNNKTSGLKIDQLSELNLYTSLYKDDVAKNFDRVCEHYEEVMDYVGYPDPEKISEQVSKLCKDKDMDP
jgi:ubiquinone/menaquinone biosynthesis C-methylase UbiE